jgi:predicted RNase H-like HicB family nuclease
MKFRVLIEQDEDGVFVAQVPSLPGCVSQGQTRADAISNVREAIAGYLESLSDRNEAIPPAIEEEVVDVAV